MKINNAEINKIKPSFFSSDLALVTALSVYFPITRIDKQNPRKVVFAFERNKSLEHFLDKYWKKEIQVEPRQYFDQLKALKGRIYEAE